MIAYAPAYATRGTSQPIAAATPPHFPKLAWAEALIERAGLQSPGAPRLNPAPWRHSGFIVRTLHDGSHAAACITGLAAPWWKFIAMPNYSAAFKPGAFRASLAGGAEVVLLIDHDWNTRAARSSDGSLSLRESVAGLEFRAFLEANPHGERIVDALQNRIGRVSVGAVLKRYDITQMPSGDLYAATSAVLEEISICLTISGKAEGTRASLGWVKL